MDPELVHNCFRQSQSVTTWVFRMALRWTVEHTHALAPCGLGIRNTASFVKEGGVAQLII